MIKIIIADDHQIVKDGINYIISDFDDMEIIDSADNGNELIELLKAQKPGIVIVDINMPGLFIVDIIQEVKRIDPNIGIIVYSVNPEEYFAKRLFKAGASAYLNKQNPSEEIVKAIRTVAKGEKYLTKECAQLLFAELDKSLPANTADLLSDREIEILQNIALGKSPTEISDKLYLSVNTINNHKKNILKKLNLKSKFDLIIYAYRNRLIS